MADMTNTIDISTLEIYGRHLNSKLQNHMVGNYTQLVSKLKVMEPSSWCVNWSPVEHAVPIPHEDRIAFPHRFRMRIAHFRTALPQDSTVRFWTKPK